MGEKLKILIGYDGSDCALAALNDLRRAGLPKVARTVVLSVVETSSQPLPLQREGVASEQGNGGDKTPHPTAAFVMESARKAETAAEVLRRAGLDSSAKIKMGNPKHALLKEAEDWQTDCIFVGARGLNRLDRFLLGSVSISVATRAHCPVEVVRGPWTEPQEN